MRAPRRQPAPQGLTLASLPPEMLIECFRRLPPSAVLPVCREFRQLYYDNAHTVAVVHSGRVTQRGAATTAAVQRCSTLRRLVVPRNIAFGPTAWLTRLQHLDVPAGWALDQIPPTLAHRGGSRRVAPLLRSRPRMVQRAGRPARRRELTLRRGGARAHARGRHARPGVAREPAREAQPLRGIRILRRALHARSAGNVHAAASRAAAPLRAIPKCAVPGRARPVFAHTPRAALLRLPAVAGRPGNAQLPQLRSLELNECSSLTSLHGISSRLTRLLVRQCAAVPLEGLAVARLLQLAALELCSSTRITLLNGLTGAGLAALKQLEVTAATLLACMVSSSASPTACSV